MATEKEAKLRLTAQDETARAFQSVQNNLRKTMREVDSGARGTKQSFREGATAVDMFASSIARLASAGAIAEFTRKSYVAFADFERNMTKIGVNAGATREQMRTIGADLQSLSVKSGRSTDDLAAGFEAMQRSSKASLGEISKLFPTIVEGAEAAQVTTEQMATSVARVAAEMKIPLSETKKIVDILVEAGKLAPGALGGLVESLPRVAMQMGQMGYRGEAGMKSMLAWLTVLTREYGNAGDASQALQQVITKGNPYMVAALAESGRTGEDLLKTFLKIVATTGALEDTARGRQIARHLFDDRTIRLLNALKAGTGDYAEALNRLANSEDSAGRAAGEFNKDAKHGIDALLSSFREFTQVYGELQAALGAGGPIGALSALIDGTAKAYRALAWAIRLVKYEMNLKSDFSLEQWKRLLDGAGPAELFKKLKEHSGVPEAPAKKPVREQLADAEKQYAEAEAIKPESKGGMRAAKLHAIIDELKEQIRRGEAEPETKPQSTKPAAPHKREDNAGPLPISYTAPEPSVDRAPQQYEPAASTRDLITKAGFTPETARNERNLWERILLEMNGARTARIQFASDVLGGQPGLMNASYQPGGGGGYSGGPGVGGGLGGGGGQSPAGPGGGGLGNVPPMGGESAHAGEAAPGSNPRADHPMAPAGAAVTSNLTTVKTKGGAKFRVNPEIAENVQGFIDDYEARGGVIGPNSGGAAGRGNPSRHPHGDAIDLNQIARGVRKGGKSLPTEVENELIDKWGGGSGARFRGGKGHDAGHFEWPSYKAARDARERNSAAAAAGKPGEVETGAPAAKSGEAESNTTAGRPPTANTSETITGGASTYNPARGGDSGGTRTASGEQYNPNDYTAAIQTDLESKFFGGKKMGYGKTYKPAYAQVEHDGKKVIVRLNDRGPLYAKQGSGRVIDLNEKSMREFDPSMKKGVLGGVKITPMPYGKDYKVGPVAPPDTAVAGKPSQPEPDTWSDIGKGAGNTDALDQHRQMREEMERPIKMNIEAPALPSQLVPNFRRSSARESLSRETRDARWLSYNDIGAA